MIDEQIPDHIKSDIGKKVWRTGWRADATEVGEVSATFDVPFNVQDDKQRHPYGILVLALLDTGLQLRPWTSDFAGDNVRFFFSNEADAVVARLLYDDTING